MRVYDEWNTSTYEALGDEGKYICCNCGEVVSLDCSISDKGEHLICNRCMTKLAHLLNTTTLDIMLMIHGCS